MVSPASFVRFIKDTVDRKQYSIHHNSLCLWVGVLLEKYLSGFRHELAMNVITIPTVSVTHSPHTYTDKWKIEFNVQHTFSRCRLDGTYESYFICLFNNTSFVHYSTYSPVSCSVLIHWTLTLWKSDEIDIIINVTFTITTNMYYWLMQVEWRKIRFDFYIVINKSNSSISL